LTIIITRATHSFVVERCPSVRLSHSGIVSKRTKISKRFDDLVIPSLLTNCADTLAVLLPVPISRHFRGCKSAAVQSRIVTGAITSYLYLLPFTPFQGEPLQRGRKIHTVGNFFDFRNRRYFFPETVRDRPMVTMER